MPNSSTLKKGDSKLEYKIVVYINLCLFLFYLITHYEFNISPFRFDLVNNSLFFDAVTQKIGATFTGILSPLFALLAGYLTYIAFRNQQIQNVINR
ncbi:hypothetical protein [Flavobacterium sp.]|uniref:hypothetical protein n=1 Tax=Flavobacterium sp. TaxID=239 RepID=UPI00260CA695|nr:hypothetical protein [Flavobacterium sp.]